jgi:signal transduction histidine kinase
MRSGLIARAVGAGAVLVVLIGGAFTILLVAIENLRESGRESTEARQSLTASDQLQASVIDLETGQRGFVITGKERFLQPWFESRRAIPAQEAKLTGLAQSPDERAQVRRIISHITAYLREYSIPLVRSARRRGTFRARSIAVTEEGKNRVDALRSEFDQLAATERAQLTRRQEAADDDAHRAIVLAAAGLGGSVVLILLVSAYLVRSTVLPIRRTSAMAGRLAQGELDVRLPETGIGEIGTLERSFNRMGASLQESYSELSASRARIVTAGDETRRRIQRDLHDGAQQSLVRTVITLKLARRALGDREGDTAKLIDEALEHAEHGNQELRELAHGILPAVLTRGGLRAGVESLTSRVALPVRVDVTDQRLPPTLEATAYFITAEALTNVVKHAQAQRAEVGANLDGGVLRLEISDDGVGGAKLGGGVGLLGLKDRAAAVGGELKIEDAPGGGTIIIATLPVRPARELAGTE